jgi:hypothetical protein
MANALQDEIGQPVVINDELDVVFAVKWCLLNAAPELVQAVQDSQNPGSLHLRYMEGRSGIRPET